MSSPIDVRRLFLALWPDTAIGARLAGIAQAVPGIRPVAVDKLHLTLVFLGATTAERLICYERALADLVVPSLELRFEHLGYWPRTGILWLGPRATPPLLAELVAELNQRLAECGFRPERRPFRAHVTLARKCTQPPPSLAAIGEPFIWRAERIALMESSLDPRGARYRMLKCWPG